MTNLDTAPTADDHNDQPAQEHSDTTDPPPKRPTSLRRIAANKRNAQFSTGAKTPEGKRTISLNAQKTGMHGGLHAVHSGPYREDPIEIDALVAGVMESLRPRDDLEERLALKIATLMQRMTRAERVEAVNFSAIGRLEADTITPEDLFDAQYEAAIYTRAAATLERDPSTYTSTELADLALIQGQHDPILAKAYEGLSFAEGSGSGVLARILASIDAVYGSRSAARDHFVKVAADARKGLPDPTAESALAEAVTRVALKDGTIEATTRIQVKLSLDLDRQLARYNKLQARRLPGASTDSQGTPEATGA